MLSGVEPWTPLHSGLLLSRLNEQHPATGAAPPRDVALVGGSLPNFLPPPPPRPSSLPAAEAHFLYPPDGRGRHPFGVPGSPARRGRPISPPRRPAGLRTWRV